MYLIMKLKLLFSILIIINIPLYVFSEINYVNSDLKNEPNEVISEIMSEYDEIKNTENIDEVTVTATKLNRSVYAVPASLSIVNKKQIDNSPVIYADEALRMISGVYVKRSKMSDKTPSVSLRGFSGDARTLVLLDGVPLNDGYNQSVNWGAVPFDVISKIEVVKGSFSSLYGGNAMGGVINIITSIPDERSVKINTNYGSYNTFNSSVSFSDRFFNKKLGLYISLNQKSSDGYYSNLYQTTAKEGEGTYNATGWTKTTNNKGTDYYLVGDVGENWMTQTMIFTRLCYDIKPGSLLDFSFSSSIDEYGYRSPRSYLRDESTGKTITDGSITINDNGVNKTLTVRPHNFLNGPGNGYKNMYRLQYKNSFESVMLNSYVGYSDEKSEYFNIASGATDFGGPGSINTTKPKQTFIASLQLDIPIKKHTVTIGADYKLYNSKTEEWNLTDWKNDDSKTTVKSLMSGKQSIIASFIQTEINIIDNLKCYLGLRYDNWRNIDGKSNDGISDSTFTNTNDHHVSPKAGLVYSPKSNNKFININSIRASAGESFRTPTLFNMYRTWKSGTVTYYSNPELKPETSFTWEAGIDLSFFNNYTKISFNYYESKINNLLYNSELETGKKKYMNAGKGEIKGFEVELKQAVIMKYVDLTFNMTKQKTKITENSAEPKSVGKRFTNVPDLIYNAGLNINTDPVSFMLTYNFTGKIYSSSDNSDIVQGVYGSYDEQKLLDGKISFKLKEKVKLSVCVNNILNKEYYIYYKAPGRTFSVGLSAVF